jgi:phosphotriesterase-related protein
MFGDGTSDGDAADGGGPRGGARSELSRRHLLGIAGAAFTGLLAAAACGDDRSHAAPPAPPTGGAEPDASTSVETVTGPVRCADLGFALMHEHVFQRTEDVVNNFPHLWDREARIQQAVTALRAATDNDVKTLVDLTVAGLGRDVPLIVELSQLTGLQIIVSTGVYVLDTLPRYFRFRGIDEMADLFVHDIEAGIQGTQVKAAVVKATTDEAGVTPDVEKALRAAARAHRRTGVPISTHTQASTRRGLDQQRIFKDEGVDLSRVVIGHSGDTDDLPYLEELIEAGSYLGMDRFGHETRLSNKRRVQTIARLCERGYAERITLSGDASVANDDFDGRFENINWQAGQFGQLGRIILPALREAGVSATDIETMTVGNPRRIFEAQGAY